MAIRPYEENNTKYFVVYVNLRSKKIPTLRIQKKRKGIKSQAEALRLEKRYIKEVTQEIALKEGASSIWRIVIEKWASDAKEGYFTKLTPKTIKDTSNMLKNWTHDWLDMPCEELNRGHGKLLIKRAIDQGLTRGYIKKIKYAVNHVFNYGIEEGIIKGVNVSPVHGIQIQKKKEDKMKEILSLEECQKLLSEAKAQRHPWYYVWAIALNSGCRSSELYALRKDSVDFDLGVIRVAHSWDFENNCAKSTKKDYWRNVPISTDLKPVLREILEKYPKGEFLLPRLKAWDKGEQAQVLREFCEHIGIPSVKFHTLRACFATHLLAAGANPAVVRRIGGWKDIKSFQIYVRLAGIDEAGATEVLSFFTPNPRDKNPNSNVASLQLIKQEAR